MQIHWKARFADQLARFERKKIYINASFYFKLNRQPSAIKQLVLEHENDKEFYSSETIFPTPYTYQSKRERSINVTFSNDKTQTLKLSEQLEIAKRQKKKSFTNSSQNSLLIPI